MDPPASPGRALPPHRVLAHPLRARRLPAAGAAPLPGWHPPGGRASALAGVLEDDPGHRRQSGPRSSAGVLEDDPRPRRRSGSRSSAGALDADPGHAGTVRLI